ncbi:skin secretory protein xP2-like [Pteropus medius]|uniref:skin secretory protein xP2-like n=1 Tax=Pteropus vampyrus TaxID=132908 RepID=UPI00196B8409|nr:skin secretory protein xP2-like [Pteropus giganteus]
MRKLKQGMSILAQVHTQARDCCAAGQEAPGSAGQCAPAPAAPPRRHAAAPAPKEGSCPRVWERAPPLPSGDPGPGKSPDCVTRGVPAREPARSPAAPAPRGGGFPAALQDWPGRREHPALRSAPGGLRGASPPPAPSPPTTPLRSSGEETPAELHAPASSPLGAGSPKAEDIWVSSPPGRAPGQPGSGARPLLPRCAPTPAPGPRPRACPAPGTAASGTAAVPAGSALTPAPTPPARAWDSPARGESCGAAGAAAAALHGDLSSERGARRGGPAGPSEGGCGPGGADARRGAAGSGPSWRGRPACRGLEAAARRARRLHDPERAAGGRARRERNWLSLGSAERSQLLPGARICIRSPGGGEVTVWPLPKVWIFGVAVAQSFDSEETWRPRVQFGRVEPSRAQHSPVATTEGCFGENLRRR